MIFTTTEKKLGVYTDKNYRLVSCCSEHIVFSYARKGNGMAIHFASDKKGLRLVKRSINSFCEWIFNHYKWCEVIFAAIRKERESIIRIVLKCGFVYLADDSKHHIYARYK